MGIGGGRGDADDPAEGLLTLVVPTVPPSGCQAAFSIMAPPIWRPVRAAQLCASSGLAAWLLAASAGSRAATDTNVLRYLMTFSS